VTVLDLKPNSQDTSAFYLGKIYGFLADPNVTHASIPSPVAKPPPFSPPRYAIWVNSLWFLSLVISLSCALLATSLHQWARRYIRLTQPARCSPEKRARIRAFFAEGVDKMHIPWAVEGLPTLLHLSLFLFFGGLVIFLFNVDREVFTCVMLWIGLFSIVYGFITLLPLVRHNSPYYAPPSIPAWFLYCNIQYLTFTALSSITGRYDSYDFIDLKERYHDWMLGGMEKTAEETASDQSPEIDVRILGWTISALGNDDSLEKFFETIPGLFNSKLVKDLERYVPEKLLQNFWGALNGFMGRTLSSNLVTKSVKFRRVNICRDIMSMIPCPGHYVNDNLLDHFDHAPVSIKRLQSLARWFTHMSRYVSYAARARVAKNLARMRERDGRWVALAAQISGLPEGDTQNHIALGGDNMILATLIDVSHRTIHSHEFWLVRGLTQFDMSRTSPELQHKFCALWNEFVQEARKREHDIINIDILRLIRHHYIALHQDTEAAPSAFSASTVDSDPILFRPSSYPSCEVTSHFYKAPPHRQTSGGSAPSQRAEETSIIAGPQRRQPLSPSDQTTAGGEIGETSHVPTATVPVHSSSHPSDRSPRGGVATAQPGTTSAQSAAKLSHPLESSKQGDLAAPYAEPLADISETLSTVPIPVPAPTPRSPPVLNESFAPYDASSACISKSSLPISSASFSDPESPLPPHVPLLPNAEPLSLIGSTSPKGPSDNATLPCLSARKLVNGKMCPATAVLQLLVYCPPFLGLFRELSRLVGQRDGRETGGVATPLMDATVKFLDDFAYKEKTSLTQQSLQQVTKGKAREDEKENEEDDGMGPFITKYVYDAMEEKRQVINVRMLFFPRSGPLSLICDGILCIG
jgi:hypothetical protein